jgi:hypothetical protein
MERILLHCLYEGIGLRKRMKEQRRNDTEIKTVKKQRKENKTEGKRNGW